MDHQDTGWRDRWAHKRDGEDCVLCLRSGIDEDEWGIRVFTGEAVDGFAWKTGLIPGYVVAVWNGEHVAEPTQLASDQAATYWREVTRIGRAVETCFEPAKTNYLTLGNNIPPAASPAVPLAQGRRRPEPAGDRGSRRDRYSDIRNRSGRPPERRRPGLAAPEHHGTHC